MTRFFLGMPGHRALRFSRDLQNILFLDDALFVPPGFRLVVTVPGSAGLRRLSRTSYIGRPSRPEQPAGGAPVSAPARPAWSVSDRYGRGCARRAARLRCMMALPLVSGSGAGGSAGAATRRCCHRRRRNFNRCGNYFRRCYFDIRFDERGFFNGGSAFGSELPPEFLRLPNGVITGSVRRRRRLRRMVRLNGRLPQSLLPTLQAVPLQRGWYGGESHWCGPGVRQRFRALRCCPVPLPRS